MHIAKSLYLSAFARQFPNQKSIVFYVVFQIKKFVFGKTVSFAEHIVGQLAFRKIKSAFVIRSFKAKVDFIKNAVLDTRPLND